MHRGRLVLTHRPSKPVPFVIDLPDPTWQRQAWEEVDWACTALHKPKGKQTRDYLFKRGIRQAAWHSHMLGYNRVWGQPAVMIPHFDSRERLTGVKYHLIGEGSPGQERQQAIVLGLAEPPDGRAC